ncbi:hypothetical protein LOTGIDRAFT_157147 [Lottia gigantea]|uniref:Uncharacterized protein n=1 Tax=Lottia gigantea TaxID=225164 RepID=V4ADD1_LOTGI|nr:hypothetical protein LOTGIDRAFT_157147 [Lottia gigantea]ESP02014.1 hypothetical protein LOTGIDRAFT_157147 [Lottia gigantea]
MRSVKTTGGLTRGKGMSEVQRLQWLMSMPACASVNAAIQQFTGTSFSTSLQHKEHTTARRDRDTKDTNTILSFLYERNPFRQDESVRNIETGVTATAEVDVHRTEAVGDKIKQSLNVQNVFKRLITAADGMFDDLTAIFSYESSSFPSSIFDSSGSMRAALKPPLAEAIWSLGDCSAPNLPESNDVRYVLDGGSLLHRIPWPRSCTFQKICEMYVDFVNRKYDKAVIVFDGYASGPTTKDAAHLRRSRVVVGTKVSFSESTPCSSKRDHFLSNGVNKQAFIDLLSKHLEENGCKTFHSDGDADVLIVKNAVQCSIASPTVLIGDDTDLLVLLCFYADLGAQDIFLKSETKTTQIVKIWDIKRPKCVLGQEVCELLPFLHSITGCDTTSRLFGIGKGSVLKKLIFNKHFREQAKRFDGAETKSDVITTGEQILLSIYNGQEIDNLNSLRHQKFRTKVNTHIASVVEIHSLPPTSSAAKFHSLRSYLQIQQWKTVDNGMNPIDWGWHLSDNMFAPTMMDQLQNNF